MADEQDDAERVDVDELDLGERDESERIDEEGLARYPAERYQGVNQYGVTEAEERFGEPLEERLAREEPDPLLGEIDRTVRQQRPRSVDPDTELRGALVTPDDDDDRGFVADTTDVDLQSPEESAMHIDR